VNCNDNKNKDWPIIILQKFNFQKSFIYYLMIRGYVHFIHCFLKDYESIICN
jgi:hypothetical protein